MALRVLQPGVQPLSFDGYDGDFLTLRGGEIVGLMAVPVTTGYDLAAENYFDGYLLPSSIQKRPVVTRTITSSTRPLMLADDGGLHYGTMVGSVLGGTTGQVTTATFVGPVSQTGSGAISCWDKPGLYAVSLDACDTTASTGLTVTNTTLTAGAKLYVTSTGLITPNSAASYTGDTTVPIGHFVCFDSGGSLVTTNANMVYGNSKQKTFSWAVFHFSP